MSATTDLASPGPQGPAGRWEVVLRGGEAGAAAWRELAASYWYCVYAWWRREGRAEPAAETVACFTRWMTTEPPRAGQTGARLLREWLLARLAEWPGEAPAPAGEPTLEIAPAWAEACYAQEPAGSAYDLFQRRWAFTVLEFSMEALGAEYAEHGQGALYLELSLFAGFMENEQAHAAEAAARWQLTTGALRKEVFEFRTRHRELLRGFVADTVADAHDIDGELSALLCACGFMDEAPLPAILQALKPDELFARAMRTVQMTGGVGLWTPPSDEEAARLFPQYEMLGNLGRGGMGAVYKARQVALDRCVAIKLLPLEVSVDPAFADRFVREARAMAKLSHPHLIAVHDFGTTSEGHLYFVMEFIEGANLSELIHGHGLDPAQSLAILEQVCEALAYAHGKGVIHRDIKPANVMVDREGQAKVADFGLARLIDPAGDQTNFTRAGTVMGTPDYMAPEQSRGMDVDHRADIYPLGVMLYEMLCREVPKGIFDPPSQRTGCDVRLDEIVVRAMQQAPERRFQSAVEMGAALATASRPVLVMAIPAPPKVVARPVTPRSRTPLFAGAAVLLAALLAAWHFLPAHGEKAPPAPPARVAEASLQNPYVNSLGMKLIPVPITGGPTDGQRVLFCEWETRVQDYEVFANETKRDVLPTRFSQGPTHPVVNVSWFEAEAFCVWLTKRERAAGQIGSQQFYRLPTDHEWSCAVGLGTREDPTLPPRSKRSAVPDVFPWGTAWPPPRGAGNLPDETGHAQRPDQSKYLAGYEDGFAFTAPVGSFTPSATGLYDLSGNVWEWCEDLYDDTQRVLRGGSYDYFVREMLWSCHRGSNAPISHTGVYGFRVVLSDRPPVSSAAPAGTPRPVPQTVQFRGHRYLVVLERGLTWATAKARAEAMGGHLATLTDAEENNFVAQYTRPLAPGGFNMLWIGATRIAPTSEGFRWVTGEPFQFTAWGPKNPSSKTVGDWLTMMHYPKPGDEVAWNDYEIEAPVQNLAFYLRGFVVEWDSLQ